MHTFSVVSVYVVLFFFLLSTDVKEVEKDDDERGVS